jgi:hypothetical protein
MRGMKAERVRIPMVLIGLALVLVGTLWILQGVGIAKGSFMTGSAFWGWMGVLCVAVGLPVLVLGFRRR